MSAVLKNGKEISRNALIAMMAAILAPDYPGSTIITDSVTSDELTEFLQDELGLKHLRYKRGYKNVIDECIRQNEAGVVSPLAIETSGHGALSENYYLDDGAYLAVKLLIAATKAKSQGRDLGALIKKLGEPVESKEYRMKIMGEEDFRAYGQGVLKTFEQRAEKAGIRIAKPSYEACVSYSRMAGLSCACRCMIRRCRSTSRAASMAVWPRLSRKSRNSLRASRVLI